MVPGPSVFPSREPSVSGNFCGRIKGVKYRFALQGGTWDFPGDTGNFGVPLECPWDSLGKNTGVGCHALLQGIFQTQGLNPSLLCLLYCRRILYR